MHVGLTHHRTASHQVPSKLVCQLGVDGAYNYELVVVKDTNDWKENPAKVFATDHADQIYAGGQAARADVFHAQGGFEGWTYRSPALKFLITLCLEIGPTLSLPRGRQQVN